MQRVTIALVTVVTAAVVTHMPGRAESISLRAVSPPGKEITEFLAKKTHPAQANLSISDLDEAITPKKAANRLCGRDDEHYLGLLAKVNNIKKDELDKPGEHVKRLVFPNCLYLQYFSPRAKVVVKSEESLASIYLRLTGSPGGAESYRRFFELGSAQLANATSLQPGATLTYGYTTREVSFEPKVGEEDFLVGLAEAAARDGATFADFVARVDRRYGEILVSASPPGTSADSVCKRAESDPIDSAAIVQAFNFARAGQQPDSVRLLVIDNGFYGANDEHEDDTDLFAGSPFPKNLFLTDEKGYPQLPINLAHYIQVGSQHMLVNSVEPLNSRMGTVPDATSGHGTHVAGLAIGGATFRKAREEIPPWVKVGIMNVGKGQSTVLPNALQQILSTIDMSSPPWGVVNMSFAFMADSSSINTFASMFARAKNTLFVTASGNWADKTGKDHVPAALGGAASANVVTVTALEGTGSIAKFASHGGSYVDIAAPGCAVKSWLSNEETPAELSGTSMAAPLVSFAASLLRSVQPSLTPAQIKARLISSGDLLANEDERKQLWGLVQLNIHKALYATTDYLDVGQSRYLGQLRSIPPKATSCAAEGAFKTSEIYALKRDGERALIYHGKALGQLRGTCYSLDAGTGQVSFLATHEIVDGNVTTLNPARLLPAIPLGSVKEIVLRPS